MCTTHAALSSLTPVSYTHLDVYKRQVYLTCGNELQFRQAENGSN